jgi:hypothetical protein
LQTNGTCPLRNPEVPHCTWLFWWFSLMFVGKSMWSPIGTASKFTKHVYRRVLLPSWYMYWRRHRIYSVKNIKTNT